jgi:hypothetical protein
MATQILPVRFRAAKALSPPDRRRLRDDGLEDVVRPDAADVLVEVDIGAGNLTGDRLRRRWDLDPGERDQDVERLPGLRFGLRP